MLDAPKAVPLPDRCLDELDFVWTNEAGYRGPSVLGDTPATRLARDFLAQPRWQRLVDFIAPGVLARHGRGAEYSGFTFPEDLDPGDEPFEGVELYDPIEAFHVSQAAFDRLMSRYFDVIIDAVTQEQGPELDEPWWPELVRIAGELRARLA